VIEISFEFFKRNGDPPRAGEGGGERREEDRGGMRRGDRSIGREGEEERKWDQKKED